MVRGLLKAGIVVAALVGHLASAGAADYVAQAKALLAKGETKAAEIELKNAVRSNPKDLQARYLLAQVELSIGELVAAQANATAARAGGYDPEKTIPLLAKTYLAQRKYRQLLQDFPATSGSAAERAGVFVLRGYAQFALGNRAAAEQSFEKAQSLAPRNPEPLVAEGKLLLQEQQVAAAETKLDHALSLAPNSPEVLLANAQLSRAKRKPEQALTLLDKALKVAPGFLPARLERGETFLFEGKRQLARKDIAAVLAAQPNNIAALYLRAILLAEEGDLKKADSELDRISGALPMLARGFYIQALVKYKLGQLPQAEDAARRYLAHNPKQLAAAKLLGLIELAEGKPADAIAMLEKFTTSGRADAGTFDILGRAYTQIGRTAQALEAFEKSQKLAPKSALANLQLGATRLRMGESAGALADLERSLEIAPSSEAGETLFMTQLALGRWEAAAETVRKLQKAAPKSPISGNLLALIKLAHFDLGGARADFAALAEKYPDFLPAKLNLARVAELQGKPAEAERLLNEILKKSPANKQALTRLVALLLREGQQEKALAAAKAAHAAAPADKRITAGLVALYLRLGHKKEALTLAQDQSGSDDPANAPVIAARAEAELAAGRKSDAAQSYRRLIKLAPYAIAPRRQLAAVLLASGDAAGARKVIDEAIKSNPNTPQLAADLIAVDLKTSGIAAALATAARLRKSDPRLPTAPALEGDVYMAARQFAKATDVYREAFQRAPSPLLAARLAGSLSASGKLDAAAGVLRDWLAKHPDQIGIAQLLASIDLTAHHNTEAKQELEKVLAKQPLNAVALNDLAWLDQHKNASSARELAERAYLIAPTVPQTADTLGWILVQQHEAANALGLLEEASNVRPKDLEIRYHLAVALNDTGDRARARQLLTSLTQKTAKFDDKEAAKKLLDTLTKS